MKTLYDVALACNREGCEVRVSARLAGSTTAVQLARHSRSVGAATRIPIRIRLVADRLNVWVF